MAKKFLELPNGIPSHDTFARVFARLDPEQLQSLFLSWIKSVSQITEGEIIAIDGKTLRGSLDPKKSRETYSHGQCLGNGKSPGFRSSKSR
ncbi:hypothetical protein CYANOKiyG1_46600 [Okeania sp. KiyG1]|nr:hypothetical protein CYANOKiyG1_46600 [Okeania sp. KiyG1]